MDNARKMLGGVVEYADNAEQACDGADIAVILTEWDEFKQLDLAKLRLIMKQPRILDLRNMLDASAVRENGFVYSCIGKR